MADLYDGPSRETIRALSGQLAQVLRAQETAHDDRLRMHLENRDALNTFSEKVTELSDRIIRIESSTMTIADHENRIRDLEKHVGAASSTREFVKWLIATVVATITAIAAGGWFTKH